MRPRLVAIVAAGCFFIAAAPPASADTAAAADRQAVLSKYCFMCHNEKLKSGGAGDCKSLSIPLIRQFI